MNSSIERISVFHDLLVSTKAEHARNCDAAYKVFWDCIDNEDVEGALNIFCKERYLYAEAAISALHQLVKSAGFPELSLKYPMPDLTSSAFRRKVNAEATARVLSLALVYSPEEDLQSLVFADFSETYLDIVFPAVCIRVDRLKASGGTAEVFQGWASEAVKEASAQWVKQNLYELIDLGLIIPVCEALNPAAQDLQKSILSLVVAALENLPVKDPVSRFKERREAAYPSRPGMYTRNSLDFNPYKVYALLARAKSLGVDVECLLESPWVRASSSLLEEALYSNLFNNTDLTFTLFVAAASVDHIIDHITRSIHIADYSKFNAAADRLADLLEEIPAANLLTDAPYEDDVRKVVEVLQIANAL